MVTRRARSGIRPRGYAVSGIATCVAFAIAAVVSPGPPIAAQVYGRRTPDSPLIIGRMGVPMSFGQARHGIAFTPFVPPRNLVLTALLPPFHGDDVRANRGIGIEYADEADRRFALAQWPRNGGSIERFALLPVANRACPGARSFRRGTRPNGIVWSTPRGLIMTLQSDGKNDARTLQREWERLIRRGACR